MRTVYIDLTDENTLPKDGIDVGYTGEHNATELVIAVPPNMTSASDYLVVLFVSGGKLIRSEKITDTIEYGKPYLDGNQVHILLSKQLTKHPVLGLQVEGYKKNEQGSAVLLGKSAFLSSLHLHLSPQGEQDITGGFDSEDLSDMLDWWRNRETTPSGAGIEKYDTFECLPEDAQDGDLAYVKKDSSVLSSSFEFGKHYAAFRLKENLSADILSALPIHPDLDEDDIAQRQAGGDFCYGDDHDLCWFSMLYYAPVGSVFVFSDFRCFEDAEDYCPDGSTEPDVFLYICGEGDIGALLEDDYGKKEDIFVSTGWYKLYEEVGEYYIEDRYIHKNYKITLERADASELSVLSFIKDCYYDLDEELEPYKQNLADIFSKCLDIYEEPYHEKGLYLYKDGAWTRQETLPPIVAESKADFPASAKEGQLAYALENEYLYDSSYTFIYEGVHFGSIYFSPVLGRKAWVCDCRLHVRYGQQNYDTGGLEYFDEPIGFDLDTDVRKGLVLLSFCDSPWSGYRGKWIYVKDSGTVTVPADSVLENDHMMQLKLGMGWNRLWENGSSYSVHTIERPDEAPRIDLNAMSTNYYAEITEMESDVNETALFTSYKDSYRSDNAKGLWMFGRGRWRKANAET